MNKLFVKSYLTTTSLIGGSYGVYIANNDFKGGNDNIKKKLGRSILLLTIGSVTGPLTVPLIISHNAINYCFDTENIDDY